MQASHAMPMGGGVRELLFVACRRVSVLDNFPLPCASSKLKLVYCCKDPVDGLYMSCGYDSPWK